MKGGEAMEHLVGNIIECVLSILSIPLLIVIVMAFCAVVYAVVLYEALTLLFDHIGIHRERKNKK